MLIARIFGILGAAAGFLMLVAICYEYLVFDFRRNTIWNNRKLVVVAVVLLIVSLFIVQL